MRWPNFGLLLILVISIGCVQTIESDRLTGYVEAESVYVAAPESGWLIGMSFSEGDQVAVGDELFWMEDVKQRAEVVEGQARLREADALARDKTKGARSDEIASLRAQLEEQRAGLALAEAERERWIALVATGHAAKSRADQVIAEHEAATARVKNTESNIRIAQLMARQDTVNAAAASRDAVEASLEKAQWHLGQRKVAALVGGSVEEVIHRVGEYVVAGSPVVAILPEDGLKVRFFLPQAQLPQIELGAVVKIFVDGLATSIEAEVSHIAQRAEFTPPVIYSAASRDKLVFMVEARLDGKQKLHPGLPVEVALP